ncbi:hypothetical protein DYB37_007337 [Aphanomyces astaci]|uniref:HhH-GPD domain-containing protein n=1 Tax=Aphanomyces astaci TaxID=112090 RepID=A0A3R7AKW1_APHAT|nr:hypothetical protein DYB37_007337 [Aphanomyces astaci]
MLIPESQLRDLGFGYRAPFIVKSAAILSALGGATYLQSLRLNANAADVQTALTQFSGVGRKVADCVALFSLDKLEAIPVDTHAATKSLTPTIYAEVGKLYQDRFSPFAGWAHSILFAADLNKVKTLLSPSPAKKSKRKSPTPVKVEISADNTAIPSSSTEQLHHPNGRKKRITKKRLDMDDPSS